MGIPVVFGIVEVYYAIWPTVVCIEVETNELGGSDEID